MSSFNKVILMGNLTREPELKVTAKGTAIAKVSIAVNRKLKSESGESKEEVTFVDIDMFGRTAENVCQYMRKGSSILVEGRLKQDRWEDKTTQKPRQRLGVVAETVQFMSSNPSDQQANPSPSSPKPRVEGQPGHKIDDADVPPTESDDVPF
jgi:single-strand DNA-binding protein